MERLSGRLAEARRALASFEELARLRKLSDEQAEAALSMTDDRNLVVHVYREAVAGDLDSRLHLHAVTLAAWLGAMSR